VKIKEICEKTGLTDRTVRYYIEEQLITPFYTENYLGRKSFDFSEQDFERLKHIAILRTFGFSVDEIKELISGAGDSRQIVEAVKKRTEQSFDESNRRLNALSRLELSDEPDLLTLAQKLSASDLIVENENAGPSTQKRILAMLRSCGIFLAVWLPILLAVVVLVFKLSTIDMPLVRPSFLVYTLCCFVPSVVTVVILQSVRGTRPVFRFILVMLCVLCLPFAILFASESVTVCHHNYEIYRTVVEATCHREGEIVVRCEECGGFGTKNVENLSHIPVVVKGVAPTCGEKGICDGSYCSLCGEVLTKQEILPPVDVHTPVIDAAVPATCKNTGLTEGSHCAVCNKVLVVQTVIAKKQHIYQTEQHPPTCGAEGYKLYQCACGESYKAEIVFATNAHNFRINFNGLGYTCQGCGLKVVEHGNLDGSISGGNDLVKYYITGYSTEKHISRTLVIHGIGDIPSYQWDRYPQDFCVYPAYSISRYMLEVDTVIIESGITSIGVFTFKTRSEINYFENIRRLIIRSKDIHIERDDPILENLSKKYFLQIIYEY
jgi:DNA-binding transcriptional MerR regulator